MSKNVGKPKWKPPSPKIVEKLAKRGLTFDQIAYSLGFSSSTLHKYKNTEKPKKEYREFAEALNRGKAIGIKKISNVVYEKAKSGNIDAAKFYLERRSPKEWASKKEVEVVQQRTHAEALKELLELEEKK